MLHGVSMTGQVEDSDLLLSCPADEKICKLRKGIEKGLKGVTIL